ncbi:hypothetical protein Nepgr_032484 [Nepenthes gracilis]|uniref:Aminoacyl-tRNA synthetase class II (D/K/N) domain-containing protein n=1 Tax=Nepenthes gracilis TaxID=150966 RepID=A0AAD3TK60_NEPGR|nr:hypothetical protein Nepgr_032484 [Nepenthes gracilis]
MRAAICGAVETDKGELSVCVSSLAILTKSLLPLPDKYHGLTDVAKRYRQRYVDMIANPEVAAVLRKRAKIVPEICKTVESLGFVEIETPVLQGATGGAENSPSPSLLQRSSMNRTWSTYHYNRPLGPGG